VSWVCPMCSTSNLDTDTKCIVCDTLNPANSITFDLQQQLVNAMEQMRGVLSKKQSYNEAEVKDEYNKGVTAERKKDFVQAYEYYLKAAEKGYPPAEYEVGDCYYFGKGVSLNYSTALEWFLKSADILSGIASSE